MNEEDFMVAPPRLIHGDDEIGRALRDRQEVWDAAQRRAQPSRAQFAALSAKRERRLMLRSGLGMGAAAALLLSITSAGHLLIQSADDQKVVATPDMMHATPDALQLSPGRATETRVEVPAPSHAAPEPAAQPWPADEQSSGASNFPALRRAAVPLPAGPRPRNGSLAGSARPLDTDPQLNPAAPSSSAQAATPGSGSTHRVQDCRQLGYVDARACYTQKTEGRGITAELAYLERARLEQKQGGDAAAALRSLDEYQRRFPHGTLQPEATLARIGLLVSTHQNPEARAAIAQALPKMPEKAAQLRAVALELAVAAGDCAEAGRLLKQIPAEVATSAWKAAHLGGCAQIDR